MLRPSRKFTLPAGRRLPERKTGIGGLHPIFGGVLACSAPAAELSLLVESAARE